MWIANFPTELHRDALPCIHYYTDLVLDFWLSQSVCHCVVQVDKLHTATQLPESDPQLEEHLASLGPLEHCQLAAIDGPLPLNHHASTKSRPIFFQDDFLELVCSFSCPGASCTEIRHSKTALNQQVALSKGVQSVQKKISIYCSKIYAKNHWFCLIFCFSNWNTYFQAENLYLALVICLHKCQHEEALVPTVTYNIKKSVYFK